MWRSLREVWANPGTRGFVIGVVLVLGAGTIFYKWAEDWTWLESLYFTVVTLTTVGYGDLVPTTPLSRVVTVVLILVGVGYILAFLNFLVNITVKRRREERE